MRFDVISNGHAPPNFRKLLRVAWLAHMQYEQAGGAAPSVSVHLYDPSMQEHWDSQMAQREIIAKIVQAFVWFTKVTCLMET